MSLTTVALIIKWCFKHLNLIAFHLLVMQ